MNDFITIAISLAIALAGSYLDYYSSSVPKSGTTEYQLFKDKYSQFAPGRFVFARAVGIAIMLTIAFFNIIGGCGMLILLGVVSAIKAWLNMQANKKTRAEQIKFLNGLKILDWNSQLGGSIDAHFSTLKHAYIPPRVFYPMFNWLYAENDDATVALWAVRRKIFNLSTMPQENWFA